MPALVVRMPSAPPEPPATTLSQALGIVTRQLQLPATRPQFSPPRSAPSRLRRVPRGPSRRTHRLPVTRSTLRAGRCPPRQTAHPGIDVVPHGRRADHRGLRPPRRNLSSATPARTGQVGHRRDAWLHRPRRTPPRSPCPPPNSGFPLPMFRVPCQAFEPAQHSLGTPSDESNHAPPTAPLFHNRYPITQGTPGNPQVEAGTSSQPKMTLTRVNPQVRALKGRRVGLYAGFCRRSTSRSAGRRPSI